MKERTKDWIYYSVMFLFVIGMVFTSIDGYVRLPFKDYKAECDKKQVAFENRLIDEYNELQDKVDRLITTTNEKINLTNNLTEKYEENLELNTQLIDIVEKESVKFKEHTHSLQEHTHKVKIGRKIYEVK